MVENQTKLQHKTTFVNTDWSK